MTSVTSPRKCGRSKPQLDPRKIQINNSNVYYTNLSLCLEAPSPNPQDIIDIALTSSEREFQAVNDVTVCLHYTYVYLVLAKALGGFHLSIEGSDFTDSEIQGA
jgi:hypothetical protein